MIIQEFSSGTLEVHVNGNPQLVVQLPPQSTTHKTLGVMIYTKRRFGQTCPSSVSVFFLRRKKGQKKNRN